MAGAAQRRRRLAHRAAVVGLGVGIGALVLQMARPGQARPEPIGRVELPAGARAPGDVDEDGLDDDDELRIATEYFPYLSLDPRDECARNGVVFRLTPHPSDRSKIAIWYVVLYEKDCGLTQHVGDNEGLGVLVDPALPAPAGILAVRAISHQNTFCEHVSTCGSLPGCKPCDVAIKDGKPYPVVYASVNKHGGYVDEGACDAKFVCDFGGCARNPLPSVPPLVNAGEPGRPLTQDLSRDGFIRPELGWHAKELNGYDPWGGAKFGTAGRVAGDLDDAAFLIAPSGC